MFVWFHKLYKTKKTTFEWLQKSSENKNISFKPRHYHHLSTVYPNRHRLDYRWQQTVLSTHSNHLSSSWPCLLDFYSPSSTYLFVPKFLGFSVWIWTCFSWRPATISRRWCNTLNSWEIPANELVTRQEYCGTMIFDNNAWIEYLVISIAFFPVIFVVQIFHVAFLATRGRSSGSHFEGEENRFGYVVLEGF